MRGAPGTVRGITALSALTLTAAIAISGTGLVTAGVPVFPGTALGSLFGSTAASAAEAAATLTIGQANPGVVRPGQDLLLSATLTAPAASAVPASSLAISVNPQAVDSAAALQTQLTPGSVLSPRQSALVQVEAPALSPGESVTVPITVPSASLSALLDATSGTRVITGQLVVNGTVVTSDAAALAWYPVEAVAPTSLSMVVPIVAPEGDTGLLSAADLQSYTSPVGVLTRQLDAYANRSVTLAIDPMIIASIRVLGSAAPETATAWLDRLEAATNSTIQLGYADADPVVERLAGAGTVLAPISFASDLDPANFTAAPTDGAASATPTPTPTSTADVPSAPGLPSTSDILAWNYNSTSVAWPASGSMSPDDVEFLKSAGLTSTIVSGSNLDDGWLRNNASATAGGEALAIDDTEVSELLSRAAYAATDAEWQDAMTDAVGALLADGSAGGSLLATFDRGRPLSTARIGQTLDTTALLPWLDSSNLQTVLTSADRQEVTIKAAAADDPRVAIASSLLAYDSRITDFSSLLDTPDLLTGAARLRVLALLSNSWQSDPTELQARFATVAASFEEILSSVEIGASSTVNFLADSAALPIPLTNSLDYPVNVVLFAVPSNGRLLVEGGGSITATIAANSSERVMLPVRSISNGQVTLYLRMESATGKPIGSPSTVLLEVNAGWETLGVVIVAALVVLLFGFGIFRNIRKGRRARRVSASGGEDANTGDLS